MFRFRRGRKNGRADWVAGGGGEGGELESMGRGEIRDVRDRRNPGESRINSFGSHPEKKGEGEERKRV